MIDLNYFEKVMLYHTFRDDEYYALICDLVEPKMFHNIHIGRVMTIINEFYTENGKIPNPQEVRSRLVDREEQEKTKLVFKELKNFKNTFSREQLLKDTETFIRQRLIYSIIESASDEYAKDKHIDETKALTEIDRIHEITLHDKMGMNFFADETLAEFESKLGEKEAFISSGWRDLDKAMGGGFFKEGKSLITFGGETNVGKSIVLANIGVNVLMQDLNVLIISLEMSEFRYAKRIASIMTQIPSADMVDRSQDVTKSLTKFKRMHSSSQMYIKEFSPKSQTANSLSGYIKKLKRKTGFSPDIIILDYHTLLNASKKSSNGKHEELQTITQETRAMSYTFNAPVVSVLQLNRSANGASSSPSIGTIAGSWDMMGDIDTHVNIWQVDGDREANILRYSVKKGRDGDKGKEFQWNIDYTTLTLTAPNPYDTINSATQDKVADMADSMFDMSDLT